MTESCSNCNRQTNLYCPVQQKKVDTLFWCVNYEKAPFKHLKSADVFMDLFNGFKKR